jgi:hypothetical protein
MSEEKVNEFLEKLTALSNEYKIAVFGCGCCGSPWLSDTEEFSDKPGKYILQGESVVWTVNLNLPLAGKAFFLV